MRGGFFIAVFGMRFLFPLLVVAIFSKFPLYDIVKKLPLYGLVEVDEEANDVRGEFRLITKEGSKIPCYIVPTDEELMIARDTYRLIG